MEIRRLLKYIFVFFSICNIQLAHAHDFAAYMSPKRVPASLFEDSEGNMLTLGAFHGKVTILNFWATWCTPCRIEMPSLNQLQQDYKALGLQVISLLNSNDDMSKARSFYRRHKLRSLEHFIDKDMFTSQSFNVVGIPESYIINKEGKIIAYVSGVINWMEPNNVRFIEELLESEQ